jgi:Cupin-like domain
LLGWYNSMPMSATSRSYPSHEKIPLVALDPGSTDPLTQFDRPFVVPGSVTSSHIPRWTPESIAAKYPDVEVSVVFNLPQQLVPYALRDGSTTSTMRIADLVSKLDDGNSYNMTQVNLDMFPDLMAQFHLTFIKSRKILATNLWMGTHTRSGLHFDGADNAFVQIYGTKRLLLIDPTYSDRLYTYPDVPAKSQINPEALDVKRFPLFKQCTVLEHTLEPGDLAFIPKGWWHHLTADQVSISANCWFGEPFTTAEFAKRVKLTDPRICLRLISDFTWYGILGRPYQQRLFSPPSLGVGLYQELKAFCSQRFGKKMESR